MPHRQHVLLVLLSIVVFESVLRLSKLTCRRKYKRCPKCDQALYKSSGCDHFTCNTSLGCLAEFCYRCLADYTLIRKHGNRCALQQR